MHRLAALLTAALLLAAPSVHANEAAARAALRDNGSIALMRHALAPGVGDPAGYRLDDCATQRNLSEAGRADARAAGRALKAAGARIGQVLASPWCRCVDTATLLDLGAVRVEPAFGNAYIQSEQRESLEAAGRRVIAAWKGPGTLLVVSHGENVRDLTGVNLASGEMVVVKAQPDGTLQEIGRLQPAAR